MRGGGGILARKGSSGAERRFLHAKRRWPLGKNLTATDKSHTAPSVISPAAKGVGPTRS